MVERVRCWRCNGGGWLQVDEPECNGGVTRTPCDRCNGEGYLPFVVTPFKTGDKVVCINAHNTIRLVEGAEYEIASAVGQWVTFKGSRLSWSTERFRLAAPKPDGVNAAVSADAMITLHRVAETEAEPTPELQALMNPPAPDRTEDDVVGFSLATTAREAACLIVDVVVGHLSDPVEQSGHYDSAESVIVQFTSAQSATIAALRAEIAELRAVTPSKIYSALDAFYGSRKWDNCSISEFHEKLERMRAALAAVAKPEPANGG